MLALAAEHDWTPPVVETVATEGKGVDELWAAIGAHRAHLEASNGLAAKRAARTRDELRSLVREQLGQRAAAVCDGPSFDELVTRVADRAVDPYAAVTSLLDDPES